MKSDKSTTVQSSDHNYGSNCELILCCEKGAPSREAFDYFYHLMITYRFPMRLPPQNQQRILTLSHNQQTMLEQDELQFIKVQLEQKFPDHSIITIPKERGQIWKYNKLI